MKIITTKKIVALIMIFIINGNEHQLRAGQPSAPSFAASIASNITIYAAQGFGMGMGNALKEVAVYAGERGYELVNPSTGTIIATAKTEVELRKQLLGMNAQNLPKYRETLKKLITDPEQLNKIEQDYLAMLPNAFSSDFYNEKTIKEIAKITSTLVRGVGLTSEILNLSNALTVHGATEEERNVLKDRATQEALIAWSIMKNELTKNSQPQWQLSPEGTKIVVKSFYIALGAVGLGLTGSWAFQLIAGDE